MTSIEPFNNNPQHGYGISGVSSNVEEKAKSRVMEAATEETREYDNSMNQGGGGVSVDRGEVMGRFVGLLRE